MRENQNNIRLLFSKLGRQDSQYDELYRKVASAFGLSQCELQIYFCFLLEDEGMTQSKICSRLMAPKQTVNSAVAKLIREGMLVSEVREGNSKNKIISMTARGDEFAHKTVGRWVDAEIRASQKMGIDAMKSLWGLREQYFDLLSDEFGKMF